MNVKKWKNLYFETFIPSQYLDSNSFSKIGLQTLNVLSLWQNVFKRCLIRLLALAYIIIRTKQTISFCRSIWYTNPLTNECGYFLDIVSRSRVWKRMFPRCFQADSKMGILKEGAQWELKHEVAMCRFQNSCYSVSKRQFCHSIRYWHLFAA